MRRFYAMCSQCWTRFDLKDLTKRTTVESSTNGYEEDTVLFTCPECGHRNLGALVTSPR